ncbi:hypothetical protein FRB96_001071 [Tulasnella sp. 330]|nr:hypothetical protein FRB96_001071 [Tulasnella sp. 330]
MALSKAGRHSLGSRKPTNAEWVISGIHSIRHERRRQRFVKDVKAPYKDKNFLHRASIVAIVRKQKSKSGEDTSDADVKLINRAITDLASEGHDILQKASNHGHYILNPLYHDALDNEVASLPTKDQTDPIAISKVIRRHTKGGRAPSQLLPSPSPSARKRRRTSLGLPLLRGADGSEDDEEEEVARQVTPAPKRRGRTSISSRRASVAFPPNTDPKDRRKSKAQLLQELDEARKAATPARVRRIHEEDDDNNQETARLLKEKDDEISKLKAALSQRNDDDDEDPFVVHNGDDDEQDRLGEYHNDMQVDGGANDDQGGLGSIVADCQITPTAPTPPASSPVGPQNGRSRTISAHTSMVAPPVSKDTLAPPRSRLDRTNSQLSHPPTPAPSNRILSSSPPQHEDDDQVYEDSDRFQSAQESLGIHHQKREDKLRGQIIRLEEDLNEKETVVEELRELVVVVKEERDREKARVATLSGQVDAITSRLKQAQTEGKDEMEKLSNQHLLTVSALQSDIQNAQATAHTAIRVKDDQLVTLQEELEQTQVRLEMVEQDLSATKVALIDATELRVEDQKQHIRTISAAAVEAERRAEQVSLEHVAALMTITTEHDKLVTELHQERTNLAQRTQEKAALQQAHDALVIEVRRLEDVAADMQVQIMAATDGQRVISEELKTAVAALAGANSRIQELEGEKILVSSEHDELERQIGLLQADIVAKANEVSSARQSQQSWEQELVTAREHIVGLTSTLAASRAVHLQLTHDIDVDHKRRADLRKQLDATTELSRQLKASLTAQVDGLHKELSATETAKLDALDRLETARSTIGWLERQLTDEGKHVMSLEKTVEQWKNKFENAEAAVMALHCESDSRTLQHKEERRRLRGDLKSKDMELVDVKADLQNLKALKERDEKAVKSAQDVVRRVQQAIGVITGGFTEVSEALDTVSSSDATMTHVI